MLDQVSGQFLYSTIAVYEPIFGLARRMANQVKKASRPTPEMLTAALDFATALVLELPATELYISGDIGRRAVDASFKYGKAAGHLAFLNMGAAYSYACAKAKRVPLIYKGNEFKHTDVNAEHTFRL